MKRTTPADSVVWRGPEQLRPLLVPLSAISAHPENPKDHDLGAIAASLARFGQQTPVLVQRATGWVVAGNGRWESIPLVAELETTLGVGPGTPWTHVAAVFTDMDELTAKAYAIADNRTHDLGGYHEDVLARVLSELAAADQLVGIGYDGDDVDRLLAELANRDGDPLDPTAAWGGMPGYDHEDLESWRSIVVHFRDQDGLDDFVRRLDGNKPTPGRPAMWWPPAEIARLAEHQYAEKPLPTATAGSRRVGAVPE